MKIEKKLQCNLLEKKTRKIEKKITVSFSTIFGTLSVRIANAFHFQ